MQHPFEGVMAAIPEATATRFTRRSMMGRLFGTFAGLLGFATAASAQGWGRRPTTFAYGEEGGRVTTYALGEEGGRQPRRRATTYALGEEGGRIVPPPVPPVPSIPPVPPVTVFPPNRYPTTLAYGEEGGGY